MKKKFIMTKASVSKEMEKMRCKIKALKTEMYEHEVMFGYYNGYTKMKSRLENYEEQYYILQTAWNKCDWAEKTGLPINDDTTLYITVNVTEESPCVSAYMYFCNYCHSEMYSYEKHEVVECPKCKRYIRTYGKINMKIKIDHEE